MPPGPARDWETGFSYDNIRRGNRTAPSRAGLLEAKPDPSLVSVSNRTRKISVLPLLKTKGNFLALVNDLEASWLRRQRGQV
ncbi:hypothetical protein NDU88_000372 [Pleurodeles waltl]|uniref:Uncharacterized protein n=1 Tax=Pleurodeles waltl TaxID=8319 RepID=A0AAV7MLU1_PLEWA|nr:hypothetical protein NDU88_000372 [Pleurodeles waltl]